MKKTTVIAFSGGLDSTSLLWYLKERGDFVIAVSFIYGSKHNLYERQAVDNIKEFVKQNGIPDIHFISVDISTVFEHTKSDLLLSGGSIPEGHYEAENMKSTVVPGRNLIFASILASIAESNGATSIALGVHAGDHAIYPDCRESFITSLNATLLESTDNKVRVEAPFLKFHKDTIAQCGVELAAPLHLTRTCYKNQPIACGKCGSCQERLEAFSIINSKDPIQYE